LAQRVKSWTTLVDQSTDETLKKILHYQNLRGEQFNVPVYMILHHVFNHCTYHRGQLVTMLRQLGVEKLPSTDFIAWCVMSQKKG
jgi:uncharacterized damage-inducible protein DinB